MDPKSQLLSLAMCAAEVDRNVAQRYLIKRRLGKGVSVGTPGHPRVALRLPGQPPKV